MKVGTHFIVHKGGINRGLVMYGVVEESSGVSVLMPFV